ncbi:MAG: PorP/SprF family type IX secretion system membrane protein [Bacteroidota bacterium]
MKLPLLCSLVWLLIVAHLPAQDPSFSHFYGNKSTYNPAFVGRRGARSFTAKYRTQWGADDAQAYRTYQFLLEESMPCFFLDWGLVATRDQEGEGLLTTDEFGVRFAFFIPTSKFGKSSEDGTRTTYQSNLRIGFGGHWGRRYIDYDQLTFLDQLDPLYGLLDRNGNPNSTDFTPPPQASSPGYFSTSIGVSYHHAIDPKDVKSLVFDLGVAIHNASLFVSPRDRQSASLLGLDNPLGQRLLFTAEAEKVIYHKDKQYWSLRPQVVMEFQEGLSYVETGVATSWSRRFTFGIYYHLAKAQDIGRASNWGSLKLEMGQLSLGEGTRFDLGLGYSIQNGPLKNYVAAPFELTATFHFGKRSALCGLLGLDGRFNGADRSGQPDCPTFSSGARDKMYENIWYKTKLSKAPTDSNPVN